MSEAVAGRYARALFEISSAKGIIDTVEENLVLVTNAMNESKELKGFLTHPQIASNEKKAVITKLFESEVTDEVIHLLKLLIDRKRETMIEDIKDEYVQSANKVRGIVDAQVTTATPLSASDKEKLALDFGKLIDKKLRIDAKVDPELIGGVLVRIGNRLYDGSVAGKLTRFQQQAKHNKVR